MKVSSGVKRVVSICLCVVLTTEMIACGNKTSNIPNTMNTTNAEQITYPTISDPEITVSVIDESVDVTDSLNHSIAEGDVDDIYSMVCSSVEVNLEELGFQCAAGMAQTIENDNYSGLGMYYYDDDISLFDDKTMKSVGFVEIVPEEYDHYELDKEESIVVVDPVEGGDPEIDLICSYNYNQIASNHFVFQNKYVTYYQQSPMRIVYSVNDNIEENYNLNYGSLYDYDNREYIYDESIFTQEYQHHSAVQLFENEEYIKLEASLKKLSEEQEKAGFIVEEYNIVYISPESIQAYIDSQEEDTFFGYSVTELTETFGEGVALEYTDEGFNESRILTPEEGYNWKKFLTKIGIGCGIIIIGAVVTPLTGGASFACALWTIAKLTVTSSAIAALTAVAIETVDGMIDGKDFKEALLASKSAGLDTFANTFIIMSAASSIGVASKCIKPSACFTGDTKIKKYDMEKGIYVYVPISKICVGDYVASYDETTAGNVISRVSAVYKREVKELVNITVNGENITATLEHPFYSFDRDGWIKAGELSSKEGLVDFDRKRVEIDTKDSFEADVTVYNLTVENSHTYYVGTSEVLVHNTCDAQITKDRAKAVRDAWKKEVEAVKNNTSKYNWTAAQKKELLETGKVAGYDGHHIRTVKELIGTAKEKLIGSADDIVFLNEKNHVYVHGGNMQNPTDIDRLVELVPWITERFETLGIIM